MMSPPVKSNSSDNNHDFRPVPRAFFGVDTLIGFELYIKMGRGYVLYRAKNLPFDKETLQRLIATNIATLFVRRPDMEEFNKYTEQHLGAVLKDPKVPEEEKAVMLYSAATSRVQQVFENPKDPKNIQQTMDVVQVTMGHILKDERAFSNLSRITSHDYYTYSHCVNTCAYAIALANFWGGFTKEEIYALGLGTILHDIGKNIIPTETLNKNGDLTGAEWELIRKHPQVGVELLRETNVVPEMAYLPILQHHERMHGSGYPFGLSAEKISVMGKISAIVDAYDAMTTRRPYRRAYTPFQALQIMRRHMMGHFDPRLLVVFILFLGTVDART